MPFTITFSVLPKTASGPAAIKGPRQARRTGVSPGKCSNIANCGERAKEARRIWIFVHLAGSSCWDLLQLGFSVSVAQLGSTWLNLGAKRKSVATQEVPSETLHLQGSNESKESKFSNGDVAPCGSPIAVARWTAWDRISVQKSLKLEKKSEKTEITLSWIRESKRIQPHRTPRRSTTRSTSKS